MTVRIIRRRSEGGVTFICDSCQKTLKTHMRNFDAARAFKKRWGWSSRMRAGEWFDICADCVIDQQPVIGIEDVIASVWFEKP